MTNPKSKYKEATSFFGIDRMEKLENAIKEQSQRTKTRQMANKVFWHLKLTGAITLIIYSLGVTAFIINNEMASPGNPSAVQTSLQDEVLPITIKNDITLKINEPRKDIKIIVKKGDSLAIIAQRIIKTNGLKNSPVNRQMVMGELKNKNIKLQENQPIKYGCTLLSLSQKEIQEICKN